MSWTWSELVHDWWLIREACFITKLWMTSFNKTFLRANYGPPIIAHTDISVDGPLLPARLQLFLHVGGHGLCQGVTIWLEWLTGCKWSFPEYLIQIWSNVSQLHLSNYIVAGTRLTKWLQIKVNQHLLHLFLTFIVMIRIILHWLFNNMDIKAWLWFIFEWLEICKHGMLCILSKCVLE